MSERKRTQARKSTGGKAPRKQMCHPKLSGWRNRQNESSDEDIDRNATGDVDTQTYASTSDNQLQCNPEMTSTKTQTVNPRSIIRIQKKLDRQEETIHYQKGEIDTLRERLERATNLNGVLANERTSICNKDCCKDSL